MNVTEKCQANRLWDKRNDCDDLSVSSIILLGFMSFWVVFFFVAGARLTLLSNSALKNTDVAKKMQFFQAWIYSLIYNLVSISSLFVVASLIINGDFITGLVLIAFYVFTLAYTSQIDVIGTIGKNQGINDVDPLTMVQHLLTTYLVKAVWKITGHKERMEGIEDKPVGFGKLCCVQEIDNAHRPKVYDFKDIVGVQGAFLAIPSLFLVLGAMIRSEEINTDYPPYLLVISLVSALLAPLLGDWETFEKSKVKSLASVLFRSLELVARVSFYAFLFISVWYVAVGAFFFEFAFMWLTTIKARDTSSAGRTNSLSHKILASWESIFFTRYRRVHVDKEFVYENNTLMPYTIEFIRFIEKVLITSIGAAIIAVRLNSPSADNSIRLIIAASANVAVLIFNFIYFACVKKSELKSADVGKLKAYWMTMPLCSLLCGPAVVHVNRDNVLYEANGDGRQFHYV